jgi:hypothetical protein
MSTPYVKAAVFQELGSYLIYLFPYHSREHNGCLMSEQVFPALFLAFFFFKL